MSIPPLDKSAPHNVLDKDEIPGGEAMRPHWEALNRQIDRMEQNPPARPPLSFLGPGNAPPYQNPLGGFQPVLPSKRSGGSISPPKDPPIPPRPQELAKVEKTLLAQLYEAVREFTIILATFAIEMAIATDKWIRSKLEAD